MGYDHYRVFRRQRVNNLRQNVGSVHDRPFRNPLLITGIPFLIYPFFIYDKIFRKKQLGHKARAGCILNINNASGVTVLRSWLLWN